MTKTAVQRKQARDAGKFLLLLIGIVLVLNLLAMLFPPLFFEGITAATTHHALNFFGVPNALSVEAEAILVLNETQSVLISDLCTGILEMTILVAAILATFEAERKKRMIGAIVSVFAIFVFNQFRILTTIFLIKNASGELIEFSHDIFFRIFLFVTIAVFYALWIWWAKKKA